MISTALISVIVQVCSDTPQSVIEKASERLGAEEGQALATLPWLVGILSKDALVKLKKAMKGSSVTARELALALASAAEGVRAGKRYPDIDLVWTGPDTPSLALRDTLPQMLEMIGRARKSILVVTFAAFRTKPLMTALSGAVSRGIDLMVVVETSEDSAGQLSHDAWKAFPPKLARSGCIWYWPLSKRPTNAKGLPGKLHAKCLVIDEREFLVSSANLTEDALERNIELGVRCIAPATGHRIAETFRQLASTRVLKRLPSAAG